MRRVMNKRNIAITGGIGSGKSTVLSILRKYGYSVFSCDEIYREISITKNYIDKIQAQFPTVVREGVIDKKALSNIIFQDESAREALNKIAHPIIVNELFLRMKKAKGDLVFAEVPLLFETQEKTSFDGVIIVIREEAMRVKSIIDRDGISEKEAKKRIASQINYNELSSLTQVFQNTFVLSNNQGKEKLEKDLLNLISRMQS